MAAVEVTRSETKFVPKEVVADGDNGVETGAFGLAKLFWDAQKRMALKTEKRGELSHLFVSTFASWAPQEVQEDEEKQRPFKQVLFALAHGLKVVRVVNGGKNLLWRDNRHRYDDRRDGGRRYDDRRDGGRRYDDRRDEGGRYDDLRDGGRRYILGGGRYDDRRDSGRHYDDRRDGGRRYDDRRDEGRHYDKRPHGPGPTFSTRRHYDISRGSPTQEYSTETPR